MENKYVNADNLGTEGVKFFTKLYDDVKRADLKDLPILYAKFRGYCQNNGLITTSEDIHSIHKVPCTDEFRQHLLADIEVMIATCKSRETRLWKIIISRIPNIPSIIANFIKALI